MMKFSIIIPTLNEGKFIERCLKSIKNQTWKDKEIIIVDSFSKDSTVKTAKKYTKKIYYEKRKGCAVARNTGALYAKGEILVFVDADVKLKKDFLQRLDILFNKYDGCAFPLRMYDSRNSFIDLLGFIWNFSVYMSNKLGFAMTTGCCFAYTRKIFNKVKGFDNKLMLNEDHDLAIRTSKKGRFIMAPISIETSARRVKKYGILKFVIFHTKSGLTYLLNKKSNANYYTHD